MKRRLLLASSAFALPCMAHHGWSSFDLSRPIYLEGRAGKVAWRNPHAELELELAADAKLPADLAARAVPPQAAAVDGPALLKAAQLPKRKDKRWTVELAPLPRMDAWKIGEIKPGQALAVLGFTFADEKGEAILRAEYLFVAGTSYGLRSAPV